MKTVLEVLKASTDYLHTKGISKGRRLAEELLSHVLGIKRLDIYIQFERPLAENELDRCREGLSRLAKREPWQYVFEEVEFYGCTLKVNPSVLIPRNETEILVDLISAELAKEGVEGKTLWDVGCGSGCIGIALKKKFPALHVVLSDISSEALAVARANVLANEVEVECVQGDLLAPFEGMQADGVVCNPPYITDEEYGSLDPEVRNFEPRQALVSGVSGLEFYARLAGDLQGKLKPRSKAWFEIGTGQGAGVSALFDAQGWKNHRFERDWAGHDRFFFLETE